MKQLKFNKNYISNDKTLYYPKIDNQLKKLIFL